jgi:hypothetical protein
MKYLLIEHGDGTDEAVMTICDTPETRERLTRAAISDEPSDADSDIEQLRENGIVHFEGDPSLEWLNVCAIRGGDALGTGAAPFGYPFALPQLQWCFCLLAAQTSKTKDGSRNINQRGKK